MTVDFDDRFKDLFEPVVYGFGFEGFVCRRCPEGTPMSWWDLFGHYRWHLDEARKIWPEDELTC